MTTKSARSRKNRRDSRFWDDQRRNSQSLGCSRCADIALCGGLHTASSAFDCTTYCCGQPATCTIVCPRSSRFVDRVAEVLGFDLQKLDPVRAIPFPSLPSSVPLVYAKGRRLRPFQPTFAGVSLYQLVTRKGDVRFEHRADLLEYYGLHSSTRIVASGTEKDPPLERWWQLSSRRLGLLAQLVEIGVEAATAPNFSVFSDVPRWDNFHAMKRIAICWREMLEAGLPCALHVNARSPRDWERWTEFVRSHDEIDAIAYELATGAATRLSYHVDELRNLADRASRPLKLILRGGISQLSRLRMSYKEVSIIDTSTYMRTVNRKVAVVRESGPLAWINSPERPVVDLSALMENNHQAMLRVTAEASKRVP